MILLYLFGQSSLGLCGFVSSSEFHALLHGNAHDHHHLSHADAVVAWVDGVTSLIEACLSLVAHLLRAGEVAQLGSLSVGQVTEGEILVSVKAAITVGISCSEPS